MTFFILSLTIVLMINAIANYFIKNSKSLSIAESCTGGLLSHYFTNIPQCSSFFKGSLIVYSNESKSSLLNIPSHLILKYGVVSSTIAKKMSENIRNILKTDFGISITGFAGPSGGSNEKPVGSVFISISYKNNSLCKKFLFQGSRLEIKKQSVQQSLVLLQNCLY